MKEIVNPLLEWYKDTKRDLPWRKDKDPYHVWISEIMLQQTRIEAVKEYYERFMNRLPTIQTLSEIEEEELLKLWQGLGYYNRARNLKKAACIIVEKYQGKFPSEYEDILKLPGIGEYTAGAISSISFSKKEVAIDGNVMRVYARVNEKDMDITSSQMKKKIGIEVKKILPDTPGDFNEGVMELGEIICLPNTTPKCQECPIQKNCLAHLHHKELEFPRKREKKEKKEEKYTILLFFYKDRIALQKRTSGLLKNMWEFPNILGFLKEEDVLKEEKELVLNIEEGIENTHIFTHKKWYMKSYWIEVSQPFGNYEWLTEEEIEESYAIPTAFMPYFNEWKGRQK